jgi:hypothetical protein
VLAVVVLGNMDESEQLDVVVVLVVFDDDDDGLQ